MMIIAIGLVTEEMLRDLRVRFGGFTSQAAYELFTIMMSDTPSTQVLKRWPKASGVDNDSRYATCGRRALELLAAHHVQKPSPEFADSSSGAALFFSPLVPRSHPSQDMDLNDSGGVGGGGPVLSPQRCADLLKRFRSVNLSQLKSSIDHHIGLFDEVGSAYTFENGAHLIEYLQSYASILEETVAQGRFYASFFT